MNYPYYQQNYQQIPQASYMGARPAYMDMLQQNSQYVGIKGRPVASYDEAKASMIDFDGSVFYFPDAANQRIYTKQINLDGTSSLKVYALMKDPVPQTTLQELPENLVTKEELELIITNLTNEIQTLKGAMNSDDESSTKQHDATNLKF